MAAEPEDRTEEVAGGHRLQTQRPNTADHGRIVVTLHYTTTRDLRHERLPAWQSGHTVDLLRQYVNEYHANQRSLADLVALADDIEVDATS